MRPAAFYTGGNVWGIVNENSLVFSDKIRFVLILENHPKLHKIPVVEQYEKTI